MSTIANLERMKNHVKPETIEINVLSVRQPWASMIAGQYGLTKTIETRRWYTSYRGPLWIASAKKPQEGDLPTGAILCCTNLVDCRKMVLDDEYVARCEYYDGAFSWILRDIKAIKPIPVKGSLGIYKVKVKLPIIYL
jgi:hypothetical protein